METVMNNPFAMDLQWDPSDHGPEEIRQTSAHLSITLHGKIVTRVYSDWDKSIQDTVRISTYPLALWLASSWWRLLGEPEPERNLELSWSMAHEWGSAGHGYLWPPLQIIPDGQRLTIRCTPSPAESSEPIRYLVKLKESITVDEFSSEVKDFIRSVITRLDDLDIRETALHGLWREVADEMAHPQVASYRKMEALLRFDPDEAPHEVVAFLQDLATKNGIEAMTEVAAACNSTDPGPLLRRIVHQVEDVKGIPGNLADLLSCQKADLVPDRFTAPWDFGRDLARWVRKQFDLNEDPVSNDRLGEILGMREQDWVVGPHAPLENTPLGLAIRNENNVQVNLLFRRKHGVGRRFEVARWIADAWTASPEDLWLPASDTKTTRQKIQRAFASEFLAPLASLHDFMGDKTMDEERMEEAAIHFGVSARLIESHLANHGLVEFRGM